MCCGRTRNRPVSKLLANYRRATGARPRIVEAVLKGPKPAQKIYNKCREDYPDKPQEYCAKVAWSAYCKSKDGQGYKGCSKHAQVAR